MINLLQYDFVVRGLVAGLIIATIAPLVGMFLVLRRYSLIADTLAHVSLAGIAIGLLFSVNPIFTAVAATVTSSVVIEKLRLSKKVYGESALALFLSGSLGLAVILLSLSHGFNTNLFNYLFGSIVTVTKTDIWSVLILGLVVVIIISILFKDLVFLTFDEEAAKVSGVRDTLVNTLFISLSAITISLAIPIVGILLISALLVIPVVTALQFKKTFLPTIFIAQGLSILAVIAGLVGSFYLNLAPGGTIVVVSLIIFFLVQLII